jgi:F-type H+-transporting ATPase subunit a
MIGLSNIFLLAAEGGGEHAISLHAPVLRYLGPIPITNSMVYTVIVTVVLVFLAQLATRRVKAIPSGFQNFAEFLIESLYEMLEPIVGHHMIRRTFPLLATLFIFILCANWAGLFPGVGTVGWGHEIDGHFVVTTPLLRPPNADVNMTLGMTIVFFVLWLVWVIREQGAGGFLKHTFAPKGGMSGAILIILVPIFLFVGCIEVVSIGLRAVSLPVRLFGNNFAGESLLHAMAHVTSSTVINSLILLPFYFLELLIGAVQALVFMLLCAVYIQLNTSHEEEEH